MTIICYDIPNVEHLVVMRNTIWKLGLVGASGTSLSFFEQPKFTVKLSRVNAEENPKQNTTFIGDPKQNVIDLTKPLNKENVVDLSKNLNKQSVVDLTKTREKINVDLNKPLNLSCGQLDTDQCILVVGTTGSGKSSTIAKITGQKVRVSSSASSVTRHCQLYEKHGNDNTAVWVDTVGYDDSANLEDGETFKEVLRYIAEQRLLKIKAIVWTVLPQERKDGRLQRQADFINKFREGDIWHNVIILVKQPGSFNLGLAAQGAREAAREHCQRGEEEKIQVLGCTYLDNTIPEGMLEKLQELDDAQVKEDTRGK